MTQLTEGIGNLEIMNGQTDADGYIMNFSPVIKTLQTMKNTINKANESYCRAYMSQPAVLNDKEVFARNLKTEFPDQYDALIASEPYINTCWNGWLDLVKDGRPLSRDQQRQAKDASEALYAALEQGGLYAPTPDNTDLALQGGATNVVWNDEIAVKRNKYLALASALASKSDPAYAFGIGMATVVPGADKLSKWINHNGLERYGQDDPAFLAAMTAADPFANAREAYPGAVTAGNMLSGTILTAAGGAALGSLGVTGVARNVLLFGLPAGADSAIRQDWSKPGRAALQTGLDAAGDHTCKCRRESGPVSELPIELPK